MKNKESNGLSKQQTKSTRCSPEGEYHQRSYPCLYDERQTGGEDFFAEDETREREERDVFFFEGEDRGRLWFWRTRSMDVGGEGGDSSSESSSSLSYSHSVSSSESVSSSDSSSSSVGASRTRESIEEGDVIECEREVVLDTCIAIGVG